MSPNGVDRGSDWVEATTGIEPVYAVLQFPVQRPPTFADHVGHHYMGIRPALRSYLRPPDLLPPLLPPTTDKGNPLRSDPDDVSTLRFVFESVTCDTCGDTVPVSRPCRCGAWSPRDDVHVGDRKTALSGLAEILDAERPESGPPIDPQEAVHVLGDWIPEFFAGLNALSDESPAADPRASIERLARLRWSVQATPRLRPWLAIWDPIRAIVGSLVEVARAYLEAAQAPDPEQAQAHESPAQSYLDAAAAQAHELARRLDWWGIDASIELPGSVVRSAGYAYDITGAENILELDERGKPIYARITGSRSPPSGSGVGLLLDTGQIEMAFDADRFFEVARLAYRRFKDNQTKLVSLLDDAGWRTDLLAARREHYEARLEAETLIRRLEGQRRMEARALLRLGGKVTEKVGGTVVGLLTASGAKKQLRRNADYTSVLQAAEQAGLGRLLLGFDTRIRNADAHADFDVLDDAVVLNPRAGSPSRLSDAEFVDAVFAGIESSAAILCGLDCLLLELDHPSGRDRIEELPWLDRIRIILAASGVEPGNVATRADRLEVVGTALSTSLRPLTVIASLLPYLPEEVSRVRLRMKRGNRWVLCEVPLDPMRRWSAGEDLAKEAAYVEAMFKSTIGGRPVATANHVRKFVAFRAAERLSVPLSEAQHDFDALGELARRVRDQELRESLEALLVMKRAQEGGPPAQLSDRKKFDRLAHYLRLNPGQLRDGSVLPGEAGGPRPPLVPA